MDKTILILGASGFIGKYVFQALTNVNKNVIGTYYSHPVKNLIALNLLDDTELRRTLSTIKPDIVIFLSGTKDVMKCERTPIHAINLNVQAVQNFVSACQECELTPNVLFFSTDYVFSGSTGYYQTTDPVGPRTVYGATNFIAERILIQSGLSGTILRVSAVMGNSGGFFGWLHNHLENNRTVQLFDNTYFTPTSIGKLCRWVIDYIPKQTSLMQLVHLSDGYRLSRYEFGLLVSQCMGKPETLVERTSINLSESTFQADLSLLPCGMQYFSPYQGLDIFKDIY